MSAAKPTLHYAQALLGSVQKLIDHLRPPVSGPGRPRVALFLTIAEQFEAALHLAKVGAGTHSAVHVRSMLEALVSMNLLGQEIGYMDQMRFNRLQGEKKLYEGLLADPDLTLDQRQLLEVRLSANNCVTAVRRLGCAQRIPTPWRCPVGLRYAHLNLRDTRGLSA